MRLASNDGTYDAAVAAVHAECLVEIAHNNVDGGESAAQVSASGAELGAYDLNLTIRSAVSAARARLGEESASHFMSMVFRDYAVLLAVSSRQPSNWRGSGIKMSDSGDLGPLWISGLPGGITPEPPSPALVRSPGLPNAIPQCVSIFYSYSHRDESARNELEKHLSVLRRQDVIKNWHDRKIGAGEEWKGKIDKHLESADVVLLLVSADFLDSDYCYDIEMRRAMERHESREAIVIPIIIRSCDWHQTAFGKLQALPKDGMAVKSWRNRDEAFRDIAVGIRKVVSQLLINPG